MHQQLRMIVRSNRLASYGFECQYLIPTVPVISSESLKTSKRWVAWSVMRLGTLKINIAMFINITKNFSTLKTCLCAHFNNFVMDLPVEIIDISYTRYRIWRSADILDQKVKFHVRFSKILIKIQNRSTHVNCVQSTTPNSFWARRTVQMKKTFFSLRKKRFLGN